LGFELAYKFIYQRLGFQLQVFIGHGVIGHNDNNKNRHYFSHESPITCEVWAHGAGGWQAAVLIASAIPPAP
jgi:hypothetical protein